jgi:hypothetical protein
VVALLVAALGGGSLGAGVLTAPGARAATDPDVSVRITAVTPTTLADDATVTLSGFVTNRGDERWTKAQAYLVIAPSPFTTRQQVSDAVESETSYTGERVVELDSIDEIGTLAPGSTRPFRVQVPYEDLRISGAEGVYPVGVQVLATAEDGTRDSSAIARATTFLPRLADRAPIVPGGLVWPFVLPDLVGPDGHYLDAEGLVQRVSPGGQLRNLLDQALDAPAPATTVLVDPALLIALDDVAEGRRLPEGLTLTDAQRESARTFRTQLTDLSRRVACWTLGYARPDVLAIESSADADLLEQAVDRATADALEQAQITGRRVTWPTRTGVSERLVERVRSGGESPVLVTRAAVPDWEPRQGSVVTRRTDAGPVPLFVNAGLDAGVPGATTIATLRQRLLGEAALASLERRSDPQSRADAIVLVDPTWDPGTARPGAFTTALQAPFVRGADLEELIASSPADYTGSIPRRASARPLGGAQLAAVESLQRSNQVLQSLVVDGDDAEARGDRTVAELLSVAWRENRGGGLATARDRARSARAALEGLSVEGPPAITLSSAEGSFPLTLSNDTDEAVRVGVRISSSNPALSVPAVEPVEVEAGERRTLTVTVDVGEQTSSTLTAQLVTAEGQPVGEADSFNVRSSRVGVALWVLMGAAGLFVLLALTRRFVRGRGRAKGGEPVERGEPDE